MGWISSLPSYFDRIVARRALCIRSLIFPPHILAHNKQCGRCIWHSFCNIHMRHLLSVPALTHFAMECIHNPSVYTFFWKGWVPCVSSVLQKPLEKARILYYHRWSYMYSDASSDFAFGSPMRDYGGRSAIRAAICTRKLRVWVVKLKTHVRWANNTINPRFDQVEAGAEDVYRHCFATHSSQYAGTVTKPTEAILPNIVVFVGYFCHQSISTQ